MNLQYKISDPQYYSPQAINDKAGKFYKYGKLHGETVDFILVSGSLNFETLCLKTASAKEGRIISPSWLIGGYDVNGVQKIGFCFLYNNNGCEFNLYLEEFVAILKQLGSKDMIKIWESQLKINLTHE